MQNTGWSRPMPYVKHDVMAKKPSHTSFVHSERSSPGNKLFNKPFVDPMEGRGERRSSFQTLERIDRGPNLSQHRPNPSCNITGLYSPGIPRESMLRQNSPFLVPRTQNMQPETPTRIMTSDLQAINELQTRKDLGHQISSSDQLREALKRRLRQKTDSEKSNGSKQYLDNSPQQALQIMKSNSITEISLQSTLNYNTQGAQGAQNSSTRRPPRQFRIFDDEDEDPSLHKAAYLSSQLLHINLAPSAAKQTLRSDRPIHLGNNMRHFPN
jgi:hypothetical protein